MKEQIVKIIETEGLTPTRFADEIGVQRSSISHIISGRNKPSYDFIQKIIHRYPGISVEWLITGQGTMIKPEPPSKNSDLFNSNTKKKLADSSIINENSPIKSNTITEDRIIRKQESFNYGNSKVTDVNKVDFILVFYEDGTFKRFNERA